MLAALGSTPAYTVRGTNAPSLVEAIWERSALEVVAWTILRFSSVSRKVS